MPAEPRSVGTPPTRSTPTEMLAIVVSRADSASGHIGDHLRDVATWTDRTDSRRSDEDGGGTVLRADGVELREFDDLHLNLPDVGDAFGYVDDDSERTDPDLLVFASRHAGETGPLLTAHPTGNFGPAEFGGGTGEFARACPNAHRRVVEALETHAPSGYEVGIECTHHGPTTVGIPSMFVEVGSDEPQWEDPDAARAVAKAILALRDVDPDAPDENGTRRHLVGFGGGHYAPRFERVIRETDWTVGHIGADWCLDAMGEPGENPEVIDRAFEASAADYALVEGDRPDLIETIESLGHRAVGETWVRETTGVPLSLVETVEDRLGDVEGGVRFGERATAYHGLSSGSGGDEGARSEPTAASERAATTPDTLTVVSLPDELLAESQGIDQEATREAVEHATVAFETSESGNRADGRVVVDVDSDTAALVDELAGVLETAYETVEREAGAIVARETAFDPDRARTLGVPDGPKFGKLADGETVTVDGDEIDPSVVHVEREHRFPVDHLVVR